MIRKTLYLLTLIVALTGCDKTLHEYPGNNKPQEGENIVKVGLNTDVGKPVTTDEVAKRLAAESTVSPADTFAVLKSLGGVLGDFMANGRTVKLEGLGTFYYTAAANGNGVDTAEKVTATQITGVRVRFIPESHQSSSHQVTTRSLVSDTIFWEEWGGKEAGTGGDVDDPTGDLPDPKD